MDQVQAARIMEEQILNIARGLYHLQCDWVTFYREIFGPEGVVHRAYTTPEEVAAFEQTATYAEIQRMVCNLRQQGLEPPQAVEPTRMITVRLPKSLHEALRNEAHRHHTSMNKLCISKLLQLIDTELVPNDLREVATEKDSEVGL
jgi:predicted HicB family RNase H-like nuclease